MSQPDPNYTQQFPQQQFPQQHLQPYQQHYPANANHPYNAGPPQQYGPAGVNQQVNVTVAGGGNGCGIAGLVLGIVGLLFSWIPIVGMVAWFLVIPGVILSAIGLWADRTRGPAIGGLITSGLGLLICFSYVAALSAAGAAVAH